MTELPPPAPDESENQALAKPPAWTGGQLRPRDVQALNRSFHRLAEVQESLLAQLDRMQREAQQRARRAWLTPLLLGVGLVGGLGFLAYAVLRAPSVPTPPVIEVQAPAAPEIVVQPTPITVQAPSDPAVREMVGTLREELQAMRREQSQDRAQIADLTERLLTSEQERAALLSHVATSELAAPAGPDAAAADAPAAPITLDVPSGEADPADPWLGVVNGLLAVDGYPGLRFQEGARVPGEPALAEVLVIEWGQRGLAQAVIRAQRAEFLLQRMTGDLTIRFFGGFRTGDGARVALPEDGLRLDLSRVNVRAWLDHFPELAQTGAGAEPPPQAPAAPLGPEALAAVQRALDGFLSRPGPFSYYRLSALGGVEGDALQYVQINWHDLEGRLVKTIEADLMYVRLHEDRSAVELELRHGAFLDGGVKHPFAGDAFRMHLPQQDVAAWRASGIPLRPVERE